MLQEGRARSCKNEGEVKRTEEEGNSDPEASTKVDPPGWNNPPLQPESLKLTQLTQGPMGKDIFESISSSFESFP